MLQERVVDYFEASMDLEIRRELGRGFIFGLFAPLRGMTRGLVPVFPISELFGNALRGDLR